MFPLTNSNKRFLRRQTALTRKWWRRRRRRSLRQQRSSVKSPRLAIQQRWICVKPQTGPTWQMLDDFTLPRATLYVVPALGEMALV